MKRILKMILTGVLLFCTIFSVVGCFGEKSEEEIARELIEANSKVEVPMDSEMVYHFLESDTGFRDSSFQYTAFQFESEPTDWLNKNSFTKNAMNDEFERSFLSALRDRPDELEDIPQEFLPNFKESYYYLKTEDIYFVYMSQSLLLIAIKVTR